MHVCRTCLAKEQLVVIFDDGINRNKRSEELFLVTGVKILFKDGLTQLICTTCNNLVKDALRLRKQSSEAEDRLRTTQTLTIADLESSDSYECTHSPLNLKDLESDEDFKNEKRLTIEDLESNDSLNDTMPNYKNDVPTLENIVQCELEPLRDEIKDKKEKRYTIKDLESSDDDVQLEDKVYEDSTWRQMYMEKMRKQRQKKMISVQAETNKCMALAVQPYENNKPIKCKLCNKMLKNASIFKCHAKTHFEPEFSCEICGKKFVFNSILRYHQQRVHGKKKRLACSQCTYRAVDTQQLINHTRAAHTGERPYVCDVCGDTFRMRNTIAQHMRRHFGVRNVQCERCPAMFRSGSELSWHRNKVHLMVYTFYCYLCPQTYKNLGSVKKHLLKIHGVPLGEHLPIRSTKEMR